MATRVSDLARFGLELNGKGNDTIAYLGAQLLTPTQLTKCLQRINNLRQIGRVTRLHHPALQSTACFSRTRQEELARLMRMRFDPVGVLSVVQRVISGPWFIGPILARPEAPMESQAWRDLAARTRSDEWYTIGVGYMLRPKGDKPGFSSSAIS